MPRLKLPPPLGVALIVLLFAAAIAASLIWRAEQQNLREDRARIGGLAKDHARAIEINIERALSASYALAALVRQGKGTIDNFDAVASQMLRFYPIVSELALSPGGIVRNVVPLSGNEKVIGFDQLRDPLQGREALIARDTGKLTLVGPMKLVQGGLGAIGRLPVFLEDAEGKPYFWGFVNVVIRFPEVLVGARLPQLVEQGVDYELWRIHPDSGQKQIIAASSSNPLAAPVEQNLDLAYGNWTLSVAPAKGWGDPLGLWLMAGLGLIFSLLLGYVAILVGRLRTYQGELQQKVTERTQALARVNDDLAGREALLRHILDMSSVAIFLVDMQGRITLANQRMAEMFGWPLAALAGKEYVSLVHPAERESGRQKMLALMGSTIGSVDLDRLYWRTDQTEFWGHLTGKRFYNSSGEESGLIGVIDDITERKQMEKALRESEEQLRAIMDNAGTVIFLKDPAGRYLHVNRQYEKLFHVTSAGIEGKTDHDIFPMDMANAFIKNDKYIVQSGLSQESEEHVPHDDGVHVYISAKFPLRNAAGEIYAVCGIATDITERKAAENALRESEESYRRQFVDNTVVMLLVDPADGRVIDANNAALEFYGYPRTQLMTMSMTEINLLPAAEVRRAMASVTAGHGKRFEFQHRLADGSVRDVEVSASQIRFGERLTLHSIIHDITLRKQAEAALIRSEGLLRLSQKAARMGYYVIDLASGQWESSPILDEIWGIDASFKRDTPGWVSLLHPDHRRRLLDDFNTTIRNRSAFSREYMVIRPNDGETRWVLAWGEFEYDSTGNPLRQVGAIQDITERRRTESELRVAATTFEAQEGMTITDAAKVILRVNRAFTEITGYSAEEAVGRTPRLLSSGRHDAAFYAAMWESIESTGSWQGEIWNRRKSGEVYPEWLTITVVKSDEGVVTHYVGTFADITQRKAAEDKIKHLAFYDPLTLLPNRRLLLDRLQQALASSARSGREGALLFIDLDNFKTLNDTLGHDTGDQLLQQVAQRLTTCIREGDTVARLGGDEFVVMLEDLSANSKEAATQSETVGEKIVAALNQIYLLAGREHHSTPSIGITLFDDHINSVDELLKRADLAMYQAKAAGRNTLRFFDPAMQAVVSSRASLEADLRQGIQEQQFFLFYQPQMASTGRLTGAEALVRWKHPQRGLVSPADFIPLAEETGLILPLGHWVLETACLQLAAWAARPVMAQLTLAVNVSARQFRHPDFVEQVLAVLDHTGADPLMLKLELTESLLLDNVEDIITKMIALKAEGVGFSLDDFGTGYSSLSYLKRLPLDQLKIDQSFVRDVLTDPNDAAIARTIVALAQSMGLGVIAEGVETAEQRDFLFQQGCLAYQGYFFSRPLPLQEFEEFAQRK